MGGQVMSVLIEKNTTIPSKKTQVFSTAEDNQPAVTIHVLQGERKQAGQNKSLGRFDLSDIPPAPRGAPQIEVSFDIDADGILNVSAKDKATGKEQSVVIKSTGGLSDDEIEQMVRDAEANAAADEERKALVEARNDVDTAVFSTEKSLSEHGDKISDELKEEIQAAIDEAKASRESEDVEALKEQHTKLQEASLKIGQEIYGSGSSEPEAEPEATEAEFQEKSDDEKNEGEKE